MSSRCTKVFPDFKQGNTKFISYGKSIVKAMEDRGLKIEIAAPTPDCPSVASAIGMYMEAHK
jgi:uroporphyrinogen-III synthase